MMMDGEVKSNKYLMSPPASVHSYTKLRKSDSPRTHTSPTSILRKFPHSLRHDQKHQTKIKRSGSPVAMVIYSESKASSQPSWCPGDSDGMDSESEDSPRSSDTALCRCEEQESAGKCDRKSSASEAATPRDSYKKISVISDTSAGFWCSALVDGDALVHKSAPNLLRSESFGAIAATATTLSSSATPFRDDNDDGSQVPLQSSDSLPQLNQKHRIIQSILPKISRTIVESPESPKRFDLSKGFVKSESNLDDEASESSLRLADPCPPRPKSLDLDADERLSLIADEQVRVTPRRVGAGATRRRTVELMPRLRSFVTRRTRPGKPDSPSSPHRTPIPLVTTPPTPTGSCASLNSPVIRRDGLPMRKCDTMCALATYLPTPQPLKPINRLRVPPNGFGGSLSRMCSGCSSLLSMASSSRYSINTTGSGFVACSAASSEKPPEPIMLCKLCLLEVPLSQSMEIEHCGCVFCRDCMRLYVEFEIQEGAYDISCPDAQCRKQGIVTVNEVELLVATEMMERYMRFRLNREVDLDRNRTWCPRAGCETVCDICPREKCSPTSVHCPTCNSDFCSNCKNPWHAGATCEENSRRLAREGHADFMEPAIPFDSDLIKCCPMCNVPIEKDEGCAQMMCKRCKHVFCWYCLASLDDDFLLRHYDKGPCKNKLGHSRASVIWHRTQVIGIFAGFGILLLVASPLLLVAAPCIVCCKCRVCSGTKMDPDEDLPEESGT